MIDYRMNEIKNWLLKLIDNMVTLQHLKHENPLSDSNSRTRNSIYESPKPRNKILLKESSCNIKRSKSNEQFANYKVDPGMY